MGSRHSNYGNCYNKNPPIFGHVVKKLPRLHDSKVNKILQVIVERCLSNPICLADRL